MLTLQTAGLIVSLYHDLRLTKTIRGTTINNINPNCLKQSFTAKAHMLHDNQSWR